MPKKKQSNYWKQRFDQVEQSANNKSVRYAKQLEKKYTTATKEIDKQINAWYQRIANNNKVTVAEARQLLSKSELKEFKWTVKDYIEFGKANAIDQSWMKELENASAKFHINRLEALKLECRQQIEVALADGQQNMFDTLGSVYKDTFYHSCYEIQKGVGVGFDVSKLDDGQVSKVLNKPWSVDGTNFSTKLWGNKRKLINTLDQELSRMVLTGESPQKAITNIKKAMNTSQYAAKRLVLTEQAYFCTLGQKDAFSELDVEEYEIVATLDNRTSEKCQEMDGQHFPVTEMSPGVNAPPFHVFCRSTTCPYFNDEFTINDKRVAKGDDGSWYEVPANMKYPEWKDTFVDGGSKDDLTEIPKTPKIEIITDAKDFSEYDLRQLQEWETDYYEHNNKVKLTEDEIVALDDYGEGAYEAINAIERFDEDSKEYQRVLKAYGAEEMEKAKEATEHLSSAISKLELNENIVVHRAVRDASYITGSDNSIEALQDMIGKTYTDKGYVSTSLQYQSKFTGMKDDAVHIEITVPKGSNGALIDDYVAKDEYEFLINRNQQFTVVDAGERVVQVQKYDFKSKQFVTVDKTERYMKVQLLPDELLVKNAKSGTINISKSNITVAKDTKNFDELSNYLDSTYSIKMDDSVKKLDFETVKDSIEGVESVITEFDDVGVLLEEAVTSKSGVMSCTGKTLSFNPSKFADRQQFLDMCKQQSTSGFWVQNSSPKSIGVHEAAHGVEWALIQSNPVYTYDFERIIAWNNCTEAKSIVKEAITEIKKTPYGKGKKKADLVKAISEYANNTASETMAEAFADIDANGSNANPLSIEIKKVTIKRYKQYKGGDTP